MAVWKTLSLDFQFYMQSVRNENERERVDHAWRNEEKGTKIGRDGKTIKP